LSSITSLVRLTTVRGRPIDAGDLRVTPESQVVAIHLPFGGAVWHRPTAVTVERAGQPALRLPIVDLTRVAQLAVVPGLLLLAVACLIASSQYEES
jgi:hypothetical protein